MPAATTIGELIEERARTDSTRPVIIYNEQVWTYSGLHARTNRVAWALRKLGIRHGDRVTVGIQGAVFVEVMGGLAKLGAIAVAIEPGLSVTEIKQAIADSGSVALVTIPKYAALFLQVRRELPACRHLIVVGVPMWIPSLPGGIHSYEALVSRGEVRPVQQAAKPDDIMQIVYTSGTTGQPKGVAHTHQALLWNCAALCEALEVGSTDVHLAYSPQFVLHGLWAGFRTVLAPDVQPRTLLGLIARHAPTLFFAPPAFYRAIVEEVTRSGEHPRRLQRCLVGAAPVPRALMLEVARIFQAEIITLYGQTEAAYAITYDRELEDAAVGYPIPGMEVAIVDMNDPRRTLEQGETGEVVCRGASLMAGYWEAPQLTADTLVEGWLRTGDAGYLDERGRLHLAGRLKDMIIVGEWNIYPPEIERVLLTHPHVEQAAIFGIGDGKGGEQIAAAIVARSEQRLNQEGIRRWMRGKVADWKIPALVVFHDELPVSRGGKINKRALREMLEGDVSRKTIPATALEIDRDT